MGVSYPGAILADLVFNPRDTEAIQGDISLPAFCGTVCGRLCDLDCRTDRFGSGIPQGQKIPPSIPVYRCRDMYRRLLKARELGLDEGDTSTLEED